MPGSFKNVSEDMALRQQFESITGSPCPANCKLILYTSKNRGRQKLFCKCPFNRKIHKSRKRPRGSYYSKKTFNRYRESVPNHRRNFFGDSKGHKLMAGSKIGTYRTYNSSGNLLSESNVLLTGTPQDSKSLVRTWDQTNPGPPYRSGGPFATLRYDLPNAQVAGVGLYTNAGASWQPGQARDEYRGGFVSDSQWGSDSSSNYWSLGVPQIVGYDSRAWDELKPRVSKASLAQTLYELRDMPRQLETTANLLHNSWRSFGGGYSATVMAPKSVADNFLNNEFGWAPFISDLYGLYNAYQASQKYLSELVKQNGTWVRKSRVLESKQTDSLVMRGYYSGTDPSSNSSNISRLCNTYQLDGFNLTGHFDIRASETEKIWAVGSFKYYRPEFDDSLAGFDSQFTNVNRLMTLYGLRINPTLIYKVTPWSWAIDWFSQFGKFIQRQDDFIVDGIVSRYLYIMRSYERRATKTSHINFISGPITLNWQRQLISKSRKVADSPYGFDQTWTNLSIRQWAILAAVGITNQGNGFISRGT